jgi:hypothetical protein
MRRFFVCVGLFIAVFIVQINCRLASAQTVVISYTDRGWYTDAGEHSPSNANYFVGDNRAPGCFPCSPDFRNFFVFDLSSVVTPIGSARLALFVPGPVPVPGYSSGDPSENYELHDVVTPIPTLLNGLGGVSAHADLGSGTVYGSRMMTAADMGNVIEIQLNASAIAALDAATGLIGLGGSITTFDALANSEYTFAGTNSEQMVSELRLTLVPEPATVLWCAFGVALVLAWRNRFGT